MTKPTDKQRQLMAELKPVERLVSSNWFTKKPRKNIIRIPRAFYDDHVGCRDLPAPPIVRETSRHYWIDTNHPDCAELINDAEFYINPYVIGGMDGDTTHIGARAMLRAIEKAA